MTRAKGKAAKKMALFMSLAMAVPFAGPVASVYAEKADEQAEAIANAYAEEGYTLVWNDEFDGTELNQDEWNLEEHPKGWVNEELQVYGDEDNIEVSDGTLKIYPKAVKKEKAAGEVDVLDGAGFDDSWQGADSIENGVATINVTNVGTNAWDVQFQKAGMTLTKGHNYKVSFKASALNEKTIQVNASETVNYSQFGQTTVTLGTEEAAYDLEFTMGDAEEGKFALQFNLGNFADNPETSVATTVTISDLTLVDLTEAEANPDTVDLKNDYDYTSGRISTQNKEDFIYGRFESRIRVPKGMGYLPAFWLMATDEEEYGPWPQCGEIDIMEVMGQKTDLSYHTIHYGYNTGSGHKQGQATYELTEGDFSEEFHTYVLDWEPGKLTWYVDDVKVYETSEWCTGQDEASELTYPAPYDHELYVILNLAIGGGWVGYPDQAAVDDMNNQSMEVDYVRVYQKDWSVYEEQEATCVKPEKTVTEREPDENGNYVVNGDFAEALKPMDSTEDNFELHLESDCLDNTVYAIKNNELTITPGAEGGVDYSIQLKQTGIPMVRGYEYELSFDAYADEARSIIVDVEGPDNGWVRYFGDEKVELGTENQSYSFKFTMSEKNDMNGSLEFNLGNQGSTAAVHISNIVLKQIGGEEIVDENRGLTTDGNYVFNGTFDQGEERLGYWTVLQLPNDKSEVSVSNTLDENNVRTREFDATIVIPDTGLYQLPVVLGQTDLAPITKGRYKLTFDAYSEDGVVDGMKAGVGGKKYLPELTEEMQTFTYNIEFDENLDEENSYVSFLFYKPGTYHLDNVRLVEDALIKNGSFDAGIGGYSYGVYNGGAAEFSVAEEVDGHDTVLDAAIESNGTADWHVQFKSSATTLEKDKYYKLSFDAMSTVPRTISVCMQHDGSSDGKWDTYDGDDKLFDVNETWQTFKKVFQMNAATDDNVLFSVALGYLGEELEAHDVYLDNIVLIEVDENGEPLAGNELSEEDTTDDYFRLPRLTWMELDDGSYIYLDENMEVVTDAFVKGYYVNENGIWDGEKKAVGWKQDSDGWRYYLKSDLFLTDTWMKIDGKWYSFDSEGVMEANAYRDNLYVKQNGAWDGEDEVPGWEKTAQGWWKYSIGDGKYVTKKWTKIDGKWYYFNAEGFMASEAFVQGYWLGKNGAMTNFAKCSWHKTAKGWWYGNSKWYATGTYMIDGVSQNFDDNGYWIENK